MDLSGEIVGAKIEIVDGKAAITAPSCSQLQTGRSTPGAQRPSSQKTAAGFEPMTFSTCVPQAGALTD